MGISKIYLIVVLGVLVAGCNANNAPESGLAAVASSSAGVTYSMAAAPLPPIGEDRWAAKLGPQLAGSVANSHRVRAVSEKIKKRNQLPENLASVGVYACEQPNAMSDVTSRRVALCTGLLKRIQSEDELAFLIGHEFGHIRSIYGTSEKQAYNTVTAIGAVGAMAGIGGLPGLAVAAGLATINNTLVEPNHSGILSAIDRREEQEADQIGLKLMVSAGYNPSAAVRVVDAIGDEFEQALLAKAKKPKQEEKRYEPSDPAIKMAFVIQDTLLNASYSQIDIKRHPSADKRVARIAELVTQNYSDAASRKLALIPR